MSKIATPTFKQNVVTPLKGTTTVNTSTGQSHEEHDICLWDNCRDQFPSLAHLVLHLDQCHTRRMAQFVCLWENCPRQLKHFDARYKLTTHLRCHTGEKPYQCDVVACKRSFSRLENLKLHARTHTGEKPYQCHHDSCTKKFNNTSDRAKHMKTHITRKPYACKHHGCNKSYTDPSSMRKHIKYTHKLKKETTKLGESLSPFAHPRRKRNSVSCSSNSSSSTSQTALQQLQKALVAHKLPSTSSCGSSHSVRYAGSLFSPACSTSVGVDASTITSSSSLPQPNIQLVQLQGGSGGHKGQGEHLYQQQPLMVFLPSSPTPMASHVVPTSLSSATSSSTTTIKAGLSGVQLALLPNQLSPQQMQVHPVTIALSHVMSHAQPHTSTKTATTSCASTTSVEDQLRLQIAQLQQQLYRSQLAVATATAAANRDPPATHLSPSSVSAVNHCNTRDEVTIQLFAQQERSAAQGTASQPHSTALPVTPFTQRTNVKVDVGKSSSSPEKFLQPSAKLLTAVLTGINENGGRTPMSSSVLGSSHNGGLGTMLVSTSSMSLLDMGGSRRTAVVPQFIPIPLVHSQGGTAKPQFLYMSP